MITQKDTKNAVSFECKLCHFVCRKQSNYDKHILTRKHQNNDNRLLSILKNAKKYLCDCGKEYKYRQGLYTHKQKCSYNINVLYTTTDFDNNKIDIKNDSIDLKELFVKLINENNEIKNMMVLETTKLHKQNGELQKNKIKHFRKRY
jgi:hypothetical protein